MRENRATELVFILDRSGSMQGLELDTIGGFNRMIAQQQKEPGRGFVTTVLFDHERLVLHDRVELAEVKPLTAKEYVVRGTTALLDAIGHTVKRVNKRQKADPLGRPFRTVVVITTDGFENASKEYSVEKVRSMVAKRTAKNGWEFVFLGANMDAIETAAGMGIAADHAATYVCDSAGCEAVYDAVGSAVSAVRAARPMTAAWKAGVEQDFAQRAV